MKKTIHSNKLQEKIYFLWNDDRYAEVLKEKVGDERIFTSENDLSKLLKKEKQIDGLIILAELNWEEKKLAGFYGFEKAFDLVKKGKEIPLIFCSFLDRVSLRKKTKYSPLLTRIFSFQKLPLKEDFFRNKFDFPYYSRTKWFFIQRLLREESSVYDDIKHRFQIDERNINGLKKAVEYSLEYEKLLDVDIINLLYSIDQAIKNNENGNVGSLLNNFKLHLDRMIYSTSNIGGGLLETSTKESLMLVEDNIDILKKLEKYFSGYFKVNSFSNGRKALAEINKKSKEYDVIIADLELLDDQNNWQHITGYDLLEHAEKYPHIALYGLTSMPKRAVSELQENLNTRAKIKYKHPSEYLPLGLSLDAFVEIIKDEVRELRKHKKGPKYGPWKKGLLSTYYEIRSNPSEWEDLIKEVYDRVDNLLTSKNNNNNIVPKKLHSEKKKDLGKEDLKKIIAHRLLCVYHQQRDGEFRREEYKLLTGIDYNNFKHYLTSILGFSISTSNNNAVSDETITFILNVNKDELLDEEISWINERKEIDTELIPATNFPEMMDTLNNIKKYFSDANLRAAKFNKVSDYISFFYKFAELEKEISKNTHHVRQMKAEFFGYRSTPEFSSLLRLPGTENIKDIIKNYS